MDCGLGFNTQPPKGGWFGRHSLTLSFVCVSTHSRLKAAGVYGHLIAHLNFCFNTQPPKGGWISCFIHFPSVRSFNTQPPKGGWRLDRAWSLRLCCFNTQPPKGGWSAPVWADDTPLVSTHSRLKAADQFELGYTPNNLFQHTAA